ncbi:peptide ABC transporter substrate-binding protein [Heyndrickxia shackletonii]|uniref:Peptide ABC transporter substrate-binding protein n=1 Tax=Heyndrickxia shackletonii TaxID=157838 RepID=A0A0Q3WUC8_9BACI|nr:peptide ABC transporter substrate-binding protein [Heyndrickxia shackletonii]KQL54986.1 peptide ABC transporter substrate-binding protein [Heyndrickxia shackletonii]NEZ01302.1 peptide ABC transporter substrate-binding protein [Heyndrickxia shackletonii]
MRKTKGRLGILLALSLVLSMILGACGSKSSDSSNSSASKGNASGKEVLNIMESAEIPTMNTFMAQDAVSYNAMNQVFEGLMRLGQDGVTPVLGMAAEKPTVSKDQTVYTFKLRDAKWSNGDPVTANDFVYSWRQAIDPKNSSPYGAYMMGGVIKNASEIAAKKKKPEELGVKAIDDKTLEVTLEHPIGYFESLMTFPLFYPMDQKYIESKGKEYASNSDNMVYNGPFTLTKWNGTGDSWTYEKNPNYWDKDSVKLSQINVNVVKDPGTVINLYDTNKLDWGVLSGEYAAQYKSNPDYKVLSDPSVYYLKFNQERSNQKTALANTDIRKAISMAFDKEAMATTILANGSTAANGLYPKDFLKTPGGEDVRKANGDLVKYNAKEAKALWEKGLKAIGKSKVSLELLSGDTDSAKKMDEYLKGQLEKNLPGLTITLSEPPFKVRLDRDNKQDYDIEFAGWGPDYLDLYTFSNLFLTGGDQNRMSYSDPEYDKLVNDAYSKLGKGVTKDQYFQMQLDAEKILIQKDAAIAPIYQKAIAVLQKPYVKGIVKHPFGPDYSYKWASIQK